MNERELANLYRLHAYGHFQEGIKTDDVPKLQIDGPECIDAIKSYHWWFESDLNDLAQMAHRRPAIVDGGYGPATELLLEMPRCGQPDIRSANGPQEGNWPPQCRNEITTSYNMKLSGLTTSKLTELWNESHNHWNSKVKLRLVHRPDDYPATRIYSHEASLGGNVLADQFLATSSCGFRSRGRFDNRTWDEVLFVSTCTHEHGHAIGLDHIPRDNTATMYPSITQAIQSRRGRPNSSDLALCQRIGYELGTLDPPNDPNPSMLTGEITIHSPDGDQRYVVAGSQTNG